MGGLHQTGHSTELVILPLLHCKTPKTRSEIHLTVTDENERIFGRRYNMSSNPIWWLTTLGYVPLGTPYFPVEPSRSETTQGSTSIDVLVLVGRLGSVEGLHTLYYLTVQFGSHPNPHRITRRYLFTLRVVMDLHPTTTCTPKPTSALPTGPITTPSDTYLLSIRSRWLPLSFPWLRHIVFQTVATVSSRMPSILHLDLFKHLNRFL